MSIKNQFIFNEETAEARALRPGGIAIGMAGPTLITIGTDEQKSEHLPGILGGEVVWCQGYSEPGAGSDLASLQTRAVKDGDDYIINGQKIWTSGAHRADWMIMLARTDPDAPKHRGITYFVLDMHAPGVQVQPLVNLAGTHEFNEVFFEDVRIPAKNILGEENRGWYGAVTTLDFERSSIGSAVGMRQGVEELIDFAKTSDKSGLAHREALRHELAERYIEAQGAMMMSYRIITMQAQDIIPNYEASMSKLYSMELNQRVADTAMHMLGLYGQVSGGDSHAARHGRYNYSYMRSVANTIEGGTSEIQRNIIATRGLGLPRS
jgi:alkylation response protein AidB-like acyl-CoA dehydrogenase